MTVPVATTITIKMAEVMVMTMSMTISMTIIMHNNVVFNVDEILKDRKFTLLHIKTHFISVSILFSHLKVEYCISNN